MKKLIIVLILLILAPATFGAERALTKGEVIEQLSAADFVKEKIGKLLNFAVGYDVSRVSRANLYPVIEYVKAIPKRVPPDGRTVLVLTALVDDPGGLKNIGGVRADLSSLGKFPNMMLVDNGLWGDEVPEDGVFTLQSNVAPDVKLGDKEIVVAAANKKGWLAVSSTTVDVQKDPLISEASATPDKIKAGFITSILLKVKVENPGRMEDLIEVAADLTDLNLERTVPLKLEGWFFTLQFNTPAGLSPGSKNIVIKASNKAGGLSSAIIPLEVTR